MNLWVGTSGFSYKEWNGSFYPPGTRPREMLRYYGEKLTSVEIDNTFYQLPKTGVLKGWAEQVPQRFRFALKASRRITHFKRLRGAEDETIYLLRTASALGPRLGAVLFQLPPRFPGDRDLLRSFLDLLDPAYPAAMEFRDPSWFSDDTLDLLRSRRIPLCFVDSEEGPAVPFVSTASWGYLRLRRPSYSEADIAQWLARIESQPWREAFVFFKHEEAAIGPALAASFLARAEVRAAR